MKKLKYLPFYIITALVYAFVACCDVDIIMKNHSGASFTLTDLVLVLVALLVLAISFVVNKNNAKNKKYKNEFVHILNVVNISLFLAHAAFAVFATEIWNNIERGSQAYFEASVPAVCLLVMSFVFMLIDKEEKQ